MNNVDIVNPTPLTVGDLQDRYENNLEAQKVGESSESTTIEVKYEC